MTFAEVLPLEIFASRHLRSSLLSFTTNVLFAMIIASCRFDPTCKNQCSRKIATALFSWCKPLARILQTIAASAHDRCWHFFHMSPCDRLSAAGVVSRRRESVVLYER